MELAQDGMASKVVATVGMIEGGHLNFSCRLSGVENAFEIRVERDLVEMDEDLVRYGQPVMIMLSSKPPKRLLVEIREIPVSTKSEEEIRMDRWLDGLVERTDA